MPIINPSSGGNSLVLGTPIVTTSGASHDFTGIPAGTKEIIFNIDGVSTGGTSPPILQLGDSGGIENAGYIGRAIEIIGATLVTFNSGIQCAGGWAGASVIYGSINLRLEDNTTNKWVASYVISNTAGQVYVGAGSKALSATLDRLRFTTVGGIDTFDAGSINILYQ
jgi:hypothetical protein